MSNSFAKNAIFHPPPLRTFFSVKPLSPLISQEHLRVNKRGNSSNVIVKRTLYLRFINQDIILGSLHVKMFLLVSSVFIIQ